MDRSELGDDRLPVSLFSTFQTYKRGTSILREWLHAYCKSETVAEQFTMRTILDRAKMIAKGLAKPPKRIQDISWAVLVNRRMLTRYYESLRRPSATTEDTTERHKHFNDTLAQAYQVLFPSKHRSVPRRPKSNPTPLLPTKETSRSNFEALSGILEESDADLSALLYDNEETSEPRSPSYYCQPY
ncbi:hypothetical protein K458DRAFT_385700 [Lentithecium fluviatile CBS 122367]|uniref:DUF6604 domain-containing protein n=1 Tax=Lentithecium fluviatile CBS 122367 TaxID=1168545 RepID=A0A6G1JD30_9PLEO|nr:hypothetical protein K458DRAFT_385700 [Lentithecium fluviatile CBS 122367]